MKLIKWLTVVTVCASLWACGGGGSGEGDPASATLAGDGSESWPSAKYAGTWSECVGWTQSGTDYSEKFFYEFVPVGPDGLSYKLHYSAYAAGISDCSGQPKYSYDASAGKVELLGETKSVNNVESDKVIVTVETSRRDPAGTQEKNTLGILDGLLYLGDSGGPLDSEGFPTTSFVAHRVQ